MTIRLPAILPQTGPPALLLAFAMACAADDDGRTTIDTNADDGAESGASADGTAGDTGALDATGASTDSNGETNADDTGGATTPAVDLGDAGGFVILAKS